MTEESQVTSQKSEVKKAHEEEFQYRDPRRVVHYVMGIGDLLCCLSRDDPVTWLVEAEDLLGNALSVVRLCLGTIVVDDGGA